MTTSQVAGLENFFNYIWRNTEAYVYLPVLKEGQIEQYMFQWPKQKSAVIKHVLRNVASGADVHYSPALFSKPRPQKENVLGTHVLWADFDGTAPDKWVNESIPEPTLRVQSSGPKNQHAYWALDNFLTDIPVIDERNRALAYALKADTGGWDANQFLRPPFTINTGFGKDREPTEVRIHSATKGRLNLKAFEPVPTVGQTIETDLNLGKIPDINNVLIEASWSKEFWDLFHEPKENVKDRSEALVKLAFFGVEHDFSDEQIYSVIDNADSRWEKYVNRKDRQKRLLDIITYVHEKKGGKKVEPTGLPNVIVEDQVVYGFMDILNTEVNLEWLIENLMPVGGFGIISGDPGVGKTQMGIQFACNLALGNDFLGWKNVAGRKKVLFLSLEMALTSIKHFMSLVVRQYPDDVSQNYLQNNFKVLPLGEGIPFDRPEGQAFIDSLLSEYMPDVLFIDSLQKIISKELTDEIAIRSFTEYLHKHIRKKFGCAVYIIHHNRKGNGERRIADLNDLHGSRFLSADLDWALNVSKLAKGLLTVNQTKNRLGPERDPFDIERTKNLEFLLRDAQETVRIGYDEHDDEVNSQEDDGGDQSGGTGPGGKPRSPFAL